MRNGAGLAKLNREVKREFFRDGVSGEMFFDQLVENA